MDQIRVNLYRNSYTIYIGKKLLDQKSLFTLVFKKKNNLIITNSTIKDIIFKKKNDSLFKIITKIPYYIIPDGESYKNLCEVEKVISFLLKRSYGRDLNLIALGGGVIGDITGFIASIYQRGVSFFQIPTTLLSQVDASIGGKTGVNHILGKNMIGSFWQPNGVLIDLDFLSTLPKSHIISGMAEVIKYAIIFDYKFFCWLEKNILQVLNLQEKELLYCIKKCCKLKSMVIEKDEKETSLRMFLNLGHSFAHAIETYSGYGSWLHGSAVSVGIVMAAQLSFYLNILSKSELLRIIKIFDSSGLPIFGPKNMLPDDYLELMLRDKKVLNKVIRLILPISIGQVKVFPSIDKDFLFNFIKIYQKKIYFFGLR
ncbi:3-dehydroquinate synthase [Buchnera aphidicola (Cinara strobi)]|uniref:3-dehydroquinate synthase n=1 Tax=Buchnera aphidicola (Cinara strobi) TaxID=1921549 RepID=A0A3B1E9N0_9GAMM|nr:3-dehydroquinate synthase [Buchnera aphidicola (Cinara strobi)]